mgnify:CR=1 FL=1
MKTLDALYSAGPEKRLNGAAKSAYSAWELLAPLVRTGSRRVLEKIQIRELACHSARVRPGSLYFCLPGRKVDGHSYAREAAAAGAVAIVAERALPIGASGIPVIVVEDTREALALAAARFYGFPAEKINLIGVTGTNGKTTTTYYLQSIFQAAGLPAAVVGSNGARFNNWVLQLDHTTPPSLELQQCLAMLKEKGAGVVAMEVSSHALIQRRVAHCSFNSAVFTNITRDHLDYHGTMQDYFKAKALLIGLLKKEAGSGIILNADDPSYRRLVALAGAERLKVPYAIRSPFAPVRASDVSADQKGRCSFNLLGWHRPLQISLQLPGIFNVYNALAAAAVAWKEKLPAEAVREGLNGLEAVPGRLEEISIDTPAITVIIDYAHTPDSLRQVLLLLRKRAPRRLITVFGCPGERDRGKRPLMGRIAEELSDLVVLTADNPASERVEDIIGQIREGMRSNPVEIADRAEAVHYALSQARDGDLVLLAGKGAEEYQLVGTEMIPYNDRRTVEKFMASQRRPGTPPR